jgi:hypothetical protein
MKFGKLELDPAVNPAVLDTETWSPSSAWNILSRASINWEQLSRDNLESGDILATPKTQVWRSSVGHSDGSTWCLATLSDRQSVLCCFGPSQRRDVLPSQAIGQQQLEGGDWLTAYAANSANVDRYCREFVPEKGPRALGTTPRLGIGTRMTTQVWPGAFEAMHTRDMAANSIQNSIRELSLLADLLNARPPEINYSTGIGTIETGWTGSTYEGLWLAGTLAAIKSPHRLTYGADADHVQVKRGPSGLDRARRVLEAAQYYSFFTLDMADILDYGALSAATAADAERIIERKIPDASSRRDLVSFHTQPFRVQAHQYQLDAASVGRFVGKYWDALNAVEELSAYIAMLKQGVPFDLELTIDEHPPEIAAFACLTSNEELLFLCREIERRELAITHLAPNFGQEKGCDYRAPDGLTGLERRVRSQYEIASSFGLMLDVHSGDDLKPATRRVFGRAMGGQLHFKVSPMLQLIYARLLHEYHNDLFAIWWDDAFQYAQREAANGSPVAGECLAEIGERKKSFISPDDKVFHYYSFPFVGRRDSKGQFTNRDTFYRLSAPFCAAYEKAACDWLSEVADDVFNHHVRA